MTLCPATLDEIAYNHHWHGDTSITMEVLKEYGMDKILQRVESQVEWLVEMWTETLQDIRKIIQEDN